MSELSVKDKQKISKQLYDDAQYLRKEGFEVFGVFLQGSQNYGLSYEGSDIDTKSIILPSFRDLCLNKKEFSTTHVRKNGSHLDIKDIRGMFACFLKSNINFLEIIFTDYYRITFLRLFLLIIIELMRDIQSFGKQFRIMEKTLQTIIVIVWL